jgi:hypothetical protein
MVLKSIEVRIVGRARVQRADKAIEERQQREDSQAPNHPRSRAEALVPLAENSFDSESAGPPTKEPFQHHAGARQVGQAVEKCNGPILGRSEEPRSHGEVRQKQGPARLIGEFVHAQRGLRLFDWRSHRHSKHKFREGRRARPKRAIS